MEEIKQGVSKFTEKDLTPLEKHVTSELEKIQAGHEGYKVVPVELWDEVIVCLTRGLDAAIHMDLPSTKRRIQTAIEKFKSL